MNYLLNFFSTGALRKTPEIVLSKMLSFIPEDERLNIIEVGAGNGEITGCILSKFSSNVYTYDAFEIDKNACDKLSETFVNIRVHNENAFRFRKQLIPAYTATLFVSSIPLSFFKSAILEKFCDDIKSVLQPSGFLIIIFSAPWLIPFFRRNLPRVEIHFIPTLPFYFLAVYKKGN